MASINSPLDIINCNFKKLQEYFLCAKKTKITTLFNNSTICLRADRGVASGGGRVSECIGPRGLEGAWLPSHRGTCIQLVSRSPKWGRPPRSDLPLPSMWQKPITTNVIYTLRCPPPHWMWLNVQGPEFLVTPLRAGTLNNGGTRDLEEKIIFKSLFLFSLHTKSILIAS